MLASPVPNIDGVSLVKMHEWQPHPVNLSVKQLPFARHWRRGELLEQMILVITTHVMSKNNATA